MFHSYNSLRENIQKEIENQKSVLNKFPDSISRPITQSCSKYLAQFTSYQLPFKSDTKPSGQGGGNVPIDTASTSSSSSSSAATVTIINTSSNTGSNLSSNNNSNTNNQLLNNSSSSSSTNNNLNNQSNNQSANNQLFNTNNVSSSNSSVLNSSNVNSSLLIANSQNTSVNNLVNASSILSASTYQDSDANKQNIIQLETSEQVNWVLENLMYGLTLSHDHQDIIKDCWNVYHDWLSVLLDEPKPFLPQPIKDDPIIYSKKMLWHLYHLFVPRKESQAPTKHIMMCHGVLILIESIAKDSKLLQRDLWEDFLKFFLAINDAVLAPPFNKDDFGEILSSRIVATLFEIWLIACNKVFPSPSLWKTFQELCANWRHHVSLVIEWNRVCFALTNRLLELVWWPDSGSYNSRSASSNDTNVAYDIQTIIGLMNTETVSQAWFRFFHIIGRPIDFCDIISISKSLELARAARLQKDLENFSTLNTSFSCIKKLPIIFLEVIKGISRIVDLFLGANHTNPSAGMPHFTSPINQSSSKLGASNSNPSSSTIDPKLRSKSVLVTSSADYSKNTYATLNQIFRINAYRYNRSSVNSLLHLVGQWLFEAAIKCIPDNNLLNDLSSQSESIQKINITNLQGRDYVLGQAEAYGILCKIFCSVKTNEVILPEYLSRFYALLLHGLKVPSNLGDLNANTMEYESGEILASIIVNGYNIFKVDLDGVNILVLPMLNALYSIFKLKYPQREDSKSENKQKENVKSVFNIGSSSVTLVELKRYCIYIFSSLLSLPNHFNSLGICDMNNSNLTFFSLRSKILEIFLAAMTEQDTTNLQMLFGCGKLIVGEWSMDELQKKTVQDSVTGLTENLLSNLDKKERASYCYNQIVSLICAPLKINQFTLQNHSFALSIFDSLAAIAAEDILNEDDSVCKLAISWIWHYVKAQIKRRSRDHTREMHSVIVAAYNCLIMLLITKPNLLKDKNCLQTVTNCIEIGISGSSSYPEQKLRDDNSKESSTQTLMKADKELKPASLRVKEAAECVLCFLMEHSSTPLGFNDSNDTTRIALDEKSLIELTNKNNPNKFKYFAIDGSMIIAILEKPLVKSAMSNICPTLTVILRGPFGRQAWSLHLRSSPFSSLEQVKEIKLNLSQERIGMKYNYYSNRNTIRADSVNKNDENIYPGSNGTDIKVPLCELSMPTLNEVASKCVNKNLNKFQRFKEEQIEFEFIAMDRAIQENYNTNNKNQFNDINLNIKNCQDFQTSRMILSHLGFCSLESSTKVIKDDLTEILRLDNNDPAFLDQLNSLDNLPTRTYSTCHLFYVKKNQTTIKSILDNINLDKQQLDEGFYSFIQSLGRIIDVSATSLNTTPSTEANFYRKLNKINGVDNVLQWSDITSEITFIIPNGASSSLQSSSINQSIKLDSSTSSSPSLTQDSHHSSVDETFKSKNQNLPNDIKVIVVWLEQIQDADNIPLDDLVQETYSSSLGDTAPSQKPREVIVILIHPLKSRLNRIITWSNINRKYFYTMPLIDGMVVSSRMLSSMVRQTVLNIFRRKRLEIDDYQPPHVKRKNKISEIIKKFQSKKAEADLFTSLLMN